MGLKEKIVFKSNVQSDFENQTPIAVWGNYHNVDPNKIILFQPAPVSSDQEVGEDWLFLFSLLDSLQRKKNKTPHFKYVYNDTLLTYYLRKSMQQHAN